ncbi:hypothetical protein [Streptomonospora halophila]|uniref:hypothetical protein n=1 Tax=Streptomonospora halophila TaxID=427369 RepID=UPI0031F0FD6E
MTGAVKRIWPVLAVVVLAGCGIQPSAVTGAGEAPTGVAAGPTLYFVGPDGGLRPDQRRTGGLGTVPEAMSLLLTGPGEASGLRTEIAPVSMTRVGVAYGRGVIRLHVPLTADDVTALGTDQLVCTALGVHVQSGGSQSTKVQVRFTQPAPDSDRRRSCPLME